MCHCIIASSCIDSIYSIYYIIRTGFKIQSLIFNISFIPYKARVEGPGVAKPHKIYISLKVSAMLPSNSEKQSINDIRQKEGC